jgi:glutathione S-transferase
MKSADRPIVFGAPYSVYVRAVRLALEEKGVDYELVPVDIFASEGQPAEHMVRHPFGKIPAFEHAGFRLYEAGAITRATWKRLFAVLRSNRMTSVTAPG